ncbi:MAG: CBS domain-containing protein [Candidatus Marinimicrobia bacterium]|nr:CBS domain-containing protein [Candidatus Neomarinimicrobiota bacterium]
MVIGGFRHVPIIDDDAKPVGLISVKDIINHIGNYFSKDIINLPPQPLRENYSPRDGG